MNRLAALLTLQLCTGLLNAQVDTLPPYLACKVNPTFKFSQLCQLALPAADVLDSLSDNQAPGLPL